MWIANDIGGSVSIAFEKEVIVESLILKAPQHITQVELAAAFAKIGMMGGTWSYDYDCSNSYSMLKLNVDGQTVATSPLDVVESGQTFDLVDWAGGNKIQGREITLQWASNRLACASFIKITTKEAKMTGDGALAHIVRGDDAPSGVRSGKGS